LTSAKGLAFDSSSRTLYAADAGANHIAVFVPLPVPHAVTRSATNIGATSGTLTGHVDPDVEEITNCHFEYGPDSTYSLGSVPCSPATPLAGQADVSAEVTGLTPFTTYHYRLVASGADELPAFGEDRSFTPNPGLVPAVDGASAAGLTPTTVSLTAQINPEFAPTTYRFQYGTNASYGSETASSESIGEDGVDHSVTSEVTGLSPDTVYHFRVLAVNLAGPSFGPDQTFTTPDRPTVVGSPATEVSATAATLNAGIHPGFRATTYHFEYGRNSAYGSSTPESAPIGSDNGLRGVSAAVSGLTVATSYHYRVVATNAVGTTDGPDQTFTTSPGNPGAGSPPPVSCKHGFVKKHGKCVKQNHKKHHKPHGRSHHHG
jgi:phosphodiesterase/alkaline phosphatase D-like protein